MMILESFVSTPMAHALGWTLLHSIWEGAVIALILTPVLALTRSPRVRYASACLAMLALLMTFGATLFFCVPQLGESSFLAQPISRTVVPAGEPPQPIEPGWRAAPLLPWLVPFWLVGVIALQIRSVAGWLLTGRMTRTGVYRPPDHWVQRLRELQACLRIAKPVVLVESCLTEVPVVIGYLRPLILMPLGLLAGMPAHQIEAILMHELAHIRRRDYLVNLIQTSVESLLFYHPAVWWISSVIRNERENCCDDLVVQTSGNAHEYARALAALEETRWSQGTALAATGGTLMTRIRRLLSQHPAEPRFALAPVLTACFLAIIAAAALSAWTPAAPPPQKTASPYQHWISEDVVYIVTPEERAAFHKLQTDEERQNFITQFWDRRNPVPGSATNQFKEEHYRRIAYANTRFAAATIHGWESDRGRIYIVYGPPDEIEAHPSSSATKPPFEQWLYYHIEGVGDRVIIEFDDVDSTGVYRMTSDPNKSSHNAAAATIDRNNQARVLNEELAAHPGNLDARMRLGDVYTLDKQYDKALEQYRILLNKRPDSPDLWAAIATISREKGDLPAAVENFRKAAALNPNSAVALVPLAMSLEESGQIAEALPLYEKILALDPNNVVALNNLAFLKSQEGRDLDGALKAAEKAHQLAPQIDTISDTLGAIYTRRNQPDQAIRILAGLIRKDPDSAMYHYHLAQAYLLTGDKAKANQECSAGLSRIQAKPENARYEARLRELMR